jgi:hypothetical protein
MTVMPPDVEDDVRLRRYLLGELPDEDRERLQAAYFADGELFVRLLGVEDDLIDAYVRGELTESERARFEQRFGRTARQRDRIKVARMLAAATAPAAVATPPVTADGGTRAWSSRARTLAAAAAAVLAVAAVATWRSGAERRPAEAVARPAASVARSGIAESSVPARPGTATEVPGAHRGPAYPAAQSVATLILRPGLLRDGGETPRLVLSPKTTSARLRLVLPPELPAEAAPYLVVVQTASGVEVFRARGVHEAAGPRGRAVELSLPARVLAARDHVVLLSVEPADGPPRLVRGYAFRVSRTD